jgi:hypothetical protein
VRIKELTEKTKSSMDGDDHIVEDGDNGLENVSIEGEIRVEQDGNNDNAEEIIIDHENRPSERNIDTVIDKVNELLSENEEVLPTTYTEEQNGSFGRGSDTRKEEVSHDYNLRPSRTRDYSYKFSFLSVNAGLKKWGDDAKTALIDKLKLFIKEEVFVGVKNPSE